jgi:hypothetical protein
MHTSPLTTLFDGWTQPSYEIRVRKTTAYLWGSADIKGNITFDKALVLHIRNDPLGEIVILGTETASGAQKTQTTIGSLQPGQCVSIPVQGISGVYASCALESVVGCLIKE